MDEHFNRFLNAILDTSADEPRTDFQRGLFKTAQILMNLLTGLTFALLSATLALAVLRLVTEALNLCFDQHRPGAACGVRRWKATSRILRRP